MDYSQDTAQNWKKRIFSEWGIIQDYLHYSKNIFLPTPSFEIVEQKWGCYSRDDKNNVSIKLSRHLVNNFGWGAIGSVLKHETAHYIVDYAWKMSDLSSHGEPFKKACQILNIDADRCTNIEALLTADGFIGDKEKMVEKIKKVMALTSSSAKGEAETALKKAQELMLKYNIENLDKRQAEEYLFRPVGPLYKNVPNYIRDLASTVSEYYFVKHILCWNGRNRYFEFFGTKENLDIAEYIFCCLIRQGEKLWKEHSLELKKSYGLVRGMASKACFLEGVYSGYRNQLRMQSSIREEKNVNNTTALIWTGDPLIEEMYKKAYPNIKLYHCQRHARGGGFSYGFAKGKEISIHAGIASSSAGNNGCLLSV